MKVLVRLWCMSCSVPNGYGTPISICSTILASHKFCMLYILEIGFSKGNLDLKLYCMVVFMRNTLSYMHFIERLYTENIPGANNIGDIILISHRDQMA